MGSCASQHQSADGHRFQDIEDLDLLFGSKPTTSSPSVGPAVPKGGVEAKTADAFWVKRLRKERVRPLYRSGELKAVHLELTTRCNAACPQCPRNLQGGAENPVLAAHHSELSLEDVRAILPPGFLRQLRKVYLCGNFGDPAVAQDCAEVIRYLLSVGGPRVGLFTNGGMRSPVWWEELGSIMQPPDRAFVRFAIDGDEATNHLYRQHVRWERLMANVDAFLAAGGNAEWDFIVFEHNEQQVEAMRSLAEQKGFTKFNAKKTARFIDKGRGAVKPSVPVKDTSGSVVRTLRPPANPAWQNEAALESVQKAVEKYGSIEAYYDSCEISCKVAKEKEVYISADGLAFPCCWLAAEMYRADLQNSGREVVRLAKAAFPQEGLHALSALPRGVGAAVDRRAGLFQQLVPAAMRQPSLREGRLRTCSGVCGVEVNAFTKQFAGAAQPLDPVRRSRAASAATVAPEPVEGSPVEVWYGSETGTAEHLALRAAEALGSEAAVSAPPPWDQVEARLRGCRALVLVLATWGQGEPTEDAQGLFRFLRERRGEAKGVFPALPVAIFGLGSSLWPDFNAAAREAEELIRSLGAPILIRLGEGDAAKGHLDSDFDAWLQELLVALQKLGLDSRGGPPRVHRGTESASIVPMTVVRVTRLAPRDPVARYFEVQLRGALAHGVGDALGVLPPRGGFAGARRPRWYTIASAPTNSDDQVLRLLVREVSGGVCSPYLCGLRPGDVVECLGPRRPSPLWAAWEARPSSTSRLLLVANGAGLAPFLALLEQLSVSDSRPLLYLYLGCRERPGGLLYEERLEALEAQGALQRLSVAESRPLGAAKAQRPWVQDVLKVESEEVGQLLFGSPTEPGIGLMLVCGSAAMGCAVRDVVSAIAQNHGTSVEALEAEGRYAAELW
ncbi:PETH [Symbiodinium sp. CCMP2456]|nr:PETH [Symbiodinium sp. CCMP2456]